MILCLNCNNYGFPSTYTLVKPGSRFNICTECANRMRFDGFHIVDQETMTIRLRETVKQHNKYLSNEIHRKVIQAEKEAEEEEKKKKWYLRACKMGICPECGCKVNNYIPEGRPSGVTYNPEYKCEACSFDTGRKNE